MENNNILSGGINELKTFRQIVDEYSAIKNECSRVADEEKRLEKDLSINKKELRDDIESTIKRRRNEIASTFDVEIDKSEDKLKRIRNKREKAKNEGVKDRIADETAELSSQNKDIKRTIKAMLKEEHLPGFCGTQFYFMLYFTKGVKEVFGCGLTIIIAFLLFPFLIWWALPIEKLEDNWQIVSLAGIFFVIFVLLFFVYKIIGDRTKGRHLDRLKEIRSLRDRCRSNNKEISRISMAITHDKNEDMYDLADFDRQINEEETNLSKINADKAEAISNFDRMVSVEIRNEIESRELPRINEIEKNYNQAVASHSQLAEKSKEMGLKISTEYEAYLGKEFTSVEKLDALIAIMETGSVTTVSDAINSYRAQ